MTTTTIENETTVEAPISSEPLTARDRCDAVTKTPETSTCGAQGFVRATSRNSGLTLIFCKHHSNKHQPALIAQNFHLEDFSDMINKEASASSPNN